MELPYRLKIIADVVQEGKELIKRVTPESKGITLLDIGTDHAYLPIYLFKQGYVDSCILADLREGPLNNAKINWEKNVGNAADARQGNGLSVISEGEADIITISGMGGIEIAAIIEAGYSKLKTGQVLIVQPQSKFGIARKSILSHGMAIISEKLSFEKEKITPVILAYLGKGGYVEKAALQNDTCIRVAPTDFGYELPPWYFEDESFLPAIELEKKKNIAIMESIEGSKRKSGVKMEEAYRASKQKNDYINENMGSHMKEKVL